jgi:hypothetical protein
VSRNVPDAFVQIDFSPKTVFITHYSLRTYQCAKGYSHLKSWVFEGMVGDQYLKLDTRTDTTELNGRWKTATFACQWPFECRAVRLRQTGPNHQGDHYLILRSIELFGEFV